MAEQKKMLQVRLAQPVIDTIKHAAVQDTVSPGEIVSRAIRIFRPMLYRSMVKRVKEGA
jgi:hypothetical protein